jgi:endonuclease YncB( thermonuclease family)
MRFCLPSLDKLREVAKPQPDPLWGVVTRVIDGDTFEFAYQNRSAARSAWLSCCCCSVPCCSVPWFTAKVRVYGVDCPEKNTPAGVVAKAWAMATLTNKFVELTPRGKDKYGRVLASVAVRCGTRVRDYGELVLQEKHGIPYFGGNKQQAAAAAAADAAKKNSSDV